MVFFKKIFRKKDEFALSVARVIGFYPENISFYRQAFLHKSAIKNIEFKSFESNERLEFLGDAVLETITSNYLFCKFPFKDEGYLTQLRAKLVSRQTLNVLSVKIGLNELINSKLDKESKSIYGDALEALIGAIFIDKGYLTAKKFVEQKLLQNHIDIEAVILTETDFKSRVIEWCHKEKLDFNFTISEQEAKGEKLYHAALIIDKVLKGSGVAFTKKKAEQLASEEFYKDKLL